MRSSIINKKQTGFTLIELVIVILILGLLAAVAIPKFIDLRSEARAAAVHAARGAVGSAMAIIYARAVIDGRSGLADSFVTVGGVDISIRYGYPKFGSSLLSAAGLTFPFIAPSTTNGWGDVMYYFNRGSTSLCAFPYTNATATDPAILGEADVSEC